MVMVIIIIIIIIIIIKHLWLTASKGGLACSCPYTEVTYHPTIDNNFDGYQSVRRFLKIKAFGYPSSLAF